ncbi:MAG: response regulator transcription factor [Clostridia bacterium]|nr:response regulator transcription factor [Clostridia bacterium]
MNNVKPTVLVIEDEQYISKVLETLLSADGYRVITAQNGAAARAHVFSYMPDVVLLDLGLPDMDGIQLLRELREHTHIPVIVVSARNMEKDKVAALDNGADDYITKPFSAPELLARMRAVLRRHTVAEVQEDFYAVGDFRIDFSKRVVTVKGEPVRLTQVEYRIVELIARQPGKVLTYSHIINHIWGPYADNENNRILRVNMSNIRRKIEQDRLAPKYILTEIGVGYRMAEKV